MVIESLKAQIAALTEASKEQGIPDKVKKTMTESAAELEKLLAKAREAAKEGYEEEEEKETGMDQEESGMKKEEAGNEDTPEPGHTITKTVKVKHDKHQDDGEDDEKDDDEEEGKKAAEESRKVHIEHLLQEAGIPKQIWKVEKLMSLTLKEAKAVIAEQKAYMEEAKKAVEGNLEFVPAGQGTLEESNGGENLNSLFTGCAE